jgi:hypothetical protein
MAHLLKYKYFMLPAILRALAFLIKILNVSIHFSACMQCGAASIEHTANDMCLSHCMHALTDDNSWSDVQLHALHTAQRTTHAKQANFWDTVALAVPGKTGDQCYSKWYNESDNDTSSSNAAAAAAAATADSNSAAVPQKRGRAKKATSATTANAGTADVTAAAADDDDTSSIADVPLKRGPGRPKKSTTASASAAGTDTDSAAAVEPAKRARGRPKKESNTTASAATTADAAAAAAQGSRTPHTPKLKVRKAVMS